jgi:UDP-N-acetyl-2-amino-2-deoxyglucuronate dehydrogenase
MTLKIALVGPGKVAHLHAQAVQQTPGTTLAAVCGRNPDRTAAFAAQYNAPSYTSVADMIAREGIDVCVVLTPHPNHRAPTIEALEAGAHVLVEKPLAASLADCDAMIAAAERTGRTLSVISQRRFYAPSQRIRAAIDTGKIGRPVLGLVQMLAWRDEAYYKSDPWRGSWEHEGGGVLVNQAPHQLDMLLWYMGEVESVFGQWRNVNHPYIEVEDTAVAIVQFKNGGLGNIVASNSQIPGLWGKVHLHGSNGASVGVQTDGGSMFIAGRSGIQEPPINDLWTIPGEEHLLAQWKDEDTATFGQINALTHYFGLQLADFCAAIREQRTPAITAQDGRRVVQLFEAIYESQRTGQVVRL